MEEAARELFFNDGFVFNRDLVLIAAQFRLYPDEDVSRDCIVRDVLATPNGEWEYSDHDDATISVTGLPDKNIAFFLGRNGNVLVFEPGKIREEELKDVEDYGDVLRIRGIGNSVYVCGMSGQVYRRQGNGFVHIDRGILGTDGLDFEDIDGTGPNDIYAVGMGGRIFHFDGKSWKELDSPTNRPLSNIRCVSKDEIYICGNNGLLFRGSVRNWQRLGKDDLDLNFYGLEIYQDKVYVAHPGGIMLYDGESFSEVDFRLKRPVGCHRLHGADGVLWSFGIHDLLFFDGKTWRSVTCPDNA